MYVLFRYFRLFESLGRREGFDLKHACSSFVKGRRALLFCLFFACKVGVWTWRWQDEGIFSFAFLILWHGWKRKKASPLNLKAGDLL
jgi:hypothetical protein